MACAIRAFSLSDADVAVLEKLVELYGFRSLSAALSCALKIASNSSFFSLNNSTVVESKAVNIPKLPGMNEDVWESQMRRWHLTPEEYAAIVRQTIDNFAASGKPMNNPEAAIYGACKRYANEKHQQQTETAKDTPAAANAKPSYLELQDQLP